MIYDPEKYPDSYWWDNYGDEMGLNVLRVPDHERPYFIGWAVRNTSIKEPEKVMGIGIIWANWMIASQMTVPDGFVASSLTESA